MSPTSSAEQHAADAAGTSAVGSVAGPSISATMPQGLAAVTDADGTAPGRATGSPAVHTIELRKEYRRTVALAGISMTVERGEVFGFLGPNGAGKTTAVKLLLGLARPTGGEAMVLGAPAGDVETRRKIGYLPELFRFQAWLTAREVLLLHCRLLGMPKMRWTSAVGGSLETVGLADRADDKVGSFSKGMQQRLGLGVALLGEPELVILDEPTSALDPVGRHDVREVVRHLRERGASVFLNTHLLEEVEHVCDRVAVIDKGRTIATGTLPELLGQGTRLRLQVRGLDSRWWEGAGGFREFGRFAGLEAADAGGEDWVLVEGLAPERVPDLVRAIVAVGGDVCALVPERKSLEDRFLELLGAP
jgi:ABC-2 type transport system ATP-binding protein